MLTLKHEEREKVENVSQRETQAVRAQGTHKHKLQDIQAERIGEAKSQRLLWEAL